MPREKVEARERQLASPLEKRCTKTNSKKSKRRQLFSFWCRVIDAVAEQRTALDHRVWRAEPNDAHLEADVRIWCALAGALADFLEAGRAA
jgi:hypothetical protein